MVLLSFVKINLLFCTMDPLKRKSPLSFACKFHNFGGTSENLMGHPKNLIEKGSISPILEGAQWLSGRVLDSRPRGRRFEPHRHHCVVVLEQDTFILA